MFITLSLYPAQSGGPSNTLYWLGKAICKKGLDLRTITTSRGIDKDKLPFNIWLNTNYGKVKYIDTKPYAYHPKILWEALRTVRTVDVVQLASFFYFPGYVAAFWAVFLQKKVIWSVRGEFFDSALGKSKLKQFLIVFLKYTIRNRIVFHSTSKEETEILQKVMGSGIKLTESPNFIEIPINIVNLDIKQREMYFLFIGRINKIKAIDRLIYALANSKEFLNSELTFKIAGDCNNEYGTELKLLVEHLGLNSKIDFLGLVTGEQKNNILSKARYTFLLSHSENFGNVVLESLIFGTPVCSSLNTPWRELNSFNAGKWIHNDIETITKVVDKLVNQPINEWREQSSNGYKWVRTQFDIENNIDSWIQIYNQNQ